jgi:hypothetical protein
MINIDNGIVWCNGGNVLKNFKSYILIVLFVTLYACAGNPNSKIANQCRNGLTDAYQKLDYAKVNGFEGTVEYSKAASLLAAASIQEEFGKYPNCVDKVKRAREYIKRSISQK